jgi:hypothetical protein
MAHDGRLSSIIYDLWILVEEDQDRRSILHAAAACFEKLIRKENSWIPFSGDERTLHRELNINGNNT